MSASYITLCNRVLRRLNETTFTSATFGTITGFHGQVQDCVNDAIRDINHAEAEWPFNHSATTVNLTSGTQIYGLSATNLVRVDWDSFYLVAGVPDATVWAKPLTYVDFDEWRQWQKADDLNTQVSGVGYQEIKYVFRTQHDQFGVTPTPNKNYRVGFEYWIAPTQLSGASDTTSIPDRYDYVIVDGAMWYCYMFRDNAEAASVMEKKFRDDIKRMRIELINRPDYFRSDYVVPSRAVGPNPNAF